MFYIYIPKNIKILILTHIYIYIYNINLFFFIKLIKNKYYYNNNILKVKIKYLNEKNLNEKNFINLFLFLWSNFLNKKLYFLGKGFKIKKKKCIYFNFNYSHIFLFNNKKIIIKKIKKNKIIFFYNNLKIKQILFYFKNIKSLNIFTKKGIRKSEQIIYYKKI